MTLSPEGEWLRLQGRFWRMLSVRWQFSPFESGAHLSGGRFNAIGQKALYLADTHSTAIAEYHRIGVRPGTLAAYDVQSDAIVDLTDRPRADLGADWRTLVAVERAVPPTWALATRLIANGAHGVVVPSFQRTGATNLVLWRWHAAGTGGEGAAVTLIDPDGTLRA